MFLRIYSKEELFYLYLLNVPTKAAGSSTSSTFFFPNNSANFSVTESKHISIPTFRANNMPTISATPT